MKRLVIAFACFAALLSAPATAADQEFEVWFNPRATTAIGDKTDVQFESLNQFRKASDGVDVYSFRLWLIRKLDDAVSVQIGAEQRINDGGEDEIRLAQQVSLRSGVFQARARIEQRFVNNSGRMGLRARIRGGFSIPLDDRKRWSGFGDVESFLTIRSTGTGGDDGLTGLRGRAGISHKFSDTLSASIAYQRQQDIRSNRPDRVAHAPVIGLDFSF